MSGSLYKKLLSMIKRASKGKDLKLSGVLWMQGESDGSSKELSDEYEKNIATLARIYNDLPLDFIKEKK